VRKPKQMISKKETLEEEKAGLERQQPKISLESPPKDSFRVKKGPKYGCPGN